MTAAPLLVAAALIRAPQASLPSAQRRSAALEKTIAGLQARAARVEPGSREAARVAEEIERIAAAYLADGETGRASELLSEAYALDEENGLVLAELTLCHARAEDYDAARFYLRLAEERVSRAPPEIYAALGDAYFGLHRLDDAVVAWEEFVRFGGSDPRVLARLKRAREELAVSRGQRSLALDRFTIFADPGVSDEVVRRAGADLEAFAASRAALFGEGPAAPEVVVLYAGRAYFSLASVPDWSSGLYDGKIRISVEPGASPDALSAVLAHELAHALIRRSCGNRAPAWFHEGLAQWCEGRRLPVGEIRTAAIPNPASSADALDRSFEERLARPAARASYAQALSLVEHLIALRGEGAVGCILRRLSSEEGTFEAALAAETGLSEGELFASWRKRAGFSTGPSR